MEKIILPLGGRYNLETLFRDLQDYAYGNLTNFVGLTFSSYGVNAKTTSGGAIDSSDTSLGVVLASANNLYVQAGDALTSGLHYINVPTNTSIAMDASLSDGTNSLYVKYKPLQDKLVDVIKGSYTTAGAYKVPYRERGSYEFVWNTNPGASGVWLADVIKSGTTWESFTDKRHTNVLKLATSILPDTLVRTDRAYTQVLLGAIEVPGLSVKSGANELRITPGTSGVQTLSGSDVADLKTKSHTQNTDTGTTSTSFRIGVGYFGVNKEGLPAATTSDVSPGIPLNFKLTDINSASSQIFIDSSVSSLLSTSAVGGTSIPLARVSFEWGYSNIIGSGGYNLFTVTSGIWSADYFANYFLYLSPTNTSVQILSNLATSAGNTLLSVRNTDGSNVNLSGITATSGTPGLIHSDADRYELTAIPYDSSNNLKDEARIENYIASPLNTNTNVTVNKGSLNLFLGQKYKITLRGAKQYLYSESAILTAGTYSKDSAIYSSGTISYAAPTIIQIPPLKSTGMSLSLQGTDEGFRAIIVGSQWDEADNYEFVWSTLENGADFTDTILNKKIQSEKSLDAVISDPRRYNVKARPLIAGQSVLDTTTLPSGLSGHVLSGGGGIFNDTTTLSQFYVHHRTYSGLCYFYLNNSNTLATIYLYSGIISPANGTPFVDQVTVGSDLTGEIVNLSDGGVFELYKFVTRTASGGAYGNAFVYNAKVLVVPPTYASGTYYNVSYLIGVSKLARTVHKQTLGGGDPDKLITNVFVDSDIVSDGDVTLRWYQEGATGESEADTLLITDGNLGFSAYSDVGIKTINGARNLIVDLYDELIPANNYSGFDGMVTLYAK